MRRMGARGQGLGARGRGPAPTGQGSPSRLESRGPEDIQESDPGPRPLAPDPRLVRLARALSVLGYCSRRAGEQLIAQGRVAVNRQPVSSAATLVDLATDTLFVDGKPLQRQPRLRYIALHKPRGVTSTVRDPHAKRAVTQLVPSDTRLYPVGRLDVDSEGLILLTNDGEFAHAVAHPRHRTEKEYLALVPEQPTPEALRLVREGVALDGRQAAPVRIEVARRGPGPALQSGDGGKGAWVRVVLHEGRNREVRRMLQAVGYPVVRLVRTRIGPVRLGGLRPGQYRPLRQEEVQRLMQGSGARGPRLVVAIDGPAGVGKTTVGARVAERLGAVFVDTGIFYRALTLVALERHISPKDARGLAALAGDLDIRGRGAAGGPSPEDGEPISGEIRRPEVEAHVSEVASHPEVRAALISVQRRAAEGSRAVVVGRDIGTVIFPHAHVKVFLEASAHERARRRVAQLGDASDVQEVERAMVGRDELDRTRSSAPLQPAPDAVVIDTEGIPLEEVVERICQLVPEQRPDHG